MRFHYMHYILCRICISMNSMPLYKTTKAFKSNTRGVIWKCLTSIFSRSQLGTSKGSTNLSDPNKKKTTPQFQFATKNHFLLETKGTKRWKESGSSHTMGQRILSPKMNDEQKLNYQIKLQKINKNQEISVQVREAIITNLPETGVVYSTILFNK